MNRAQRRQIARTVVKRGGASGEVTIAARRIFARNLKALPAQEQERRAEELGLEVPKPKLWTPKGLLDWVRAR